MARSPDGERALEFTVQARLDAKDVALLNKTRLERGEKSTSTYLRRLVREDAARRESGHG